MDWAHRPIVEAATKALAGAGGPVLDLGCGNGALLRKIREANPGVVPHGVDLVETSVLHARRLLPEFADRFTVGDLFERPDLWGGRLRYALVVLAPKRLLEGGAEKTARLRALMRPRGEPLLVYAYGTSLTRFGDLAGLARATGLRLVDERAERAGLADWA
jgi:hypothetical protein